jgi:hypothetical protein
MKKTITKEVPYFFKKFRTYDVEEILAAGGATAFGKQTDYDPKKLYHLKGQTLSEEDYQNALKMLTK